MTAIAKHTPGPWTWMREGLDVRIVTEKDAGIDDYDNPLAEVFAGDIETLEADARLIAASPDLLEALDLMLAVYAPLYQPDTISDAFSSAVIKARAAIAKAKPQPNPAPRDQE